MARPARTPRKKRLSDPFLKGAGIRAWLMYLAVRSVFAVIQIFPLETSLGSARLVAKVWKLVLPRHYRRAVTHIQASLGDHLAPGEVNKIAFASLESVIMFAFELIALPRRINRFNWSRYIELENFDDALRILLEGRGAVLVTGHYGSFEIIGHLLAVLGFDIVAVMRPIDNQYLNRFVVASRKAHGLSLLDKKGASAQAQERLRDGALVGFIGDQDAGHKGIFVDFFGRPASTYKSIGLLAMATNVPVIVGYARRMGRRPRYRVGVERVIRPADWESQDDPLRWITQSYACAIERIVRSDPSQYLWIHRRWKSQPTRRSGGPAPSEPKPAVPAAHPIPTS
jgi:Kdo2-lipid IVA lauroyltransferase/acyltransferase